MLIPSSSERFRRVQRRRRGHIYVTKKLF